MQLDEHAPPACCRHVHTPRLPRPPPLPIAGRPAPADHAADVHAAAAGHARRAGPVWAAAGPVGQLAGLAAGAALLGGRAAEQHGHGHGPRAAWPGDAEQHAAGNELPGGRRRGVGWDWHGSTRCGVGGQTAATGMSLPDLLQAGHICMAGSTHSAGPPPTSALQLAGALPAWAALLQPGAALVPPPLVASTTLSLDLAPPGGLGSGGQAASSLAALPPVDVRMPQAPPLPAAVPRDKAAAALPSALPVALIAPTAAAAPAVPGTSNGHKRTASPRPSGRAQPAATGLRFPRESCIPGGGCPGLCNLQLAPQPCHLPCHSPCHALCSHLCRWHAQEAEAQPLGNAVAAHPSNTCWRDQHEEPRSPARAAEQSIHTYKPLISDNRRH